MSESPAPPAEHAEHAPLATDAPGVLLYPESFERIIALLRGGIARLAAGEPFRRLAVPPVISRRTIERAGYVSAFPNLLGTVHSFTGTAGEWKGLEPLIAGGGAWHARQEPSDLVLLPAACYPVYATLDGGSVAQPARFAVEAPCFRQEATSETGRLRTFRMVELVTAGPEEHCVQWRAQWLDRVAAWMDALALKAAVEVADDPFFGAGRRLFQAAQRLQQLKFEFRVEVADGLVQAIASANYHKDHFGEVFGFDDGAGNPGHTACIAFGLERMAFALAHAHGPDSCAWPAGVLALLGG
jgi:seryl-tRNA synthetase